MAEPFARHPAGSILAEQLRAGGATELRASTIPEWVVARAPSGALIEIMRGEPGGLYYVNRYIDEPMAREALGRFVDREAAVACALLA